MARQSSRALWTNKLTGKATVRQKSVESLIAPRVPFEGVVLGVDPSLRGTGLALIRFQARKTPKLLHSRTLHLHSRLSMTECLGEIANAVSACLEMAPVDCMAIEQTIYVQNFQTAQILGAARGAAIALAAMRGIPIFEYAPLRIKQAVVGFGRASKDQVMAMMKSHLEASEMLASDEADAAATALCHAVSYRG